MKQEIKIGTTDYTALILIRDTDGAPKTGLTNASAGIDVCYTRAETDNDVVLTAGAPVALATPALTDVHLDWGFLQVDATNAPGLYRLDLPDGVFAAGAWSAVVTLICTGCDPTQIEYILVAVDKLDSVRMGMTALPNAAADAAGGLPISDAGGLDLDDIPITAEFDARTLVSADYTVVGDLGTVQSGDSYAIVNGDHGLVSVQDDIDTLLTRLSDTRATYLDYLFSIYFGLVSAVAQAQAGAAATITLAAGASAVNDFYKGQTVAVYTGTGAGQARAISAYVGATKVATVTPAWATPPDDTSWYVIMNVGSAVVEDWIDGGRLDLILDNILLDTAEIGAAGVGLTAINLPNQTMDITGNITGNLSGSVGSVAGNVDGDVSGNVDGTVAGVTPATAADVNTQVLDVLNTDTFAEPGDEAPVATTTLVNKIGYLYKFLRNKIEATATKIHVYNDAGDNKDHTSTISDDETTFTRGTFGAGE